MAILIDTSVSIDDLSRIEQLRLIRWSEEPI